MSENKDLGRLDGLSQAEPVSVSSVPASIPSAMVRELRQKAREFESDAKAKRLQARELEVRAGELFNAFISFDLLADKMENRLAQAIEVRSGETAGPEESPHAH